MTVKKTTILACLLAASVGSAAHADQVTPPAVPGNIEVPEGNKAFRMWHATGTQNYICLVAGAAWTFIGPQATLFDDDSDQALTHYLSPNPIESGVARATWHHSKDSSTVWALAEQTSTDPAFVAPGAIAWLRLRIVGAQAGPAGGEKLMQTTYIQRVNTVGGSAPSPTCSQVGARAFVPYETDYVFYRAH